MIAVLGGIGSQITLDANFFIELFGYTGSALVIISMLMTSVVKLRILNICGSTIGTIYAVIGGVWPVVLLNGSLVLINAVQLIRLKQVKGEARTKILDEKE